MNSEGMLNELARNAGGKIEEIHGPLPDGSGFAVMSMPLPKDHWLYTEGHQEPPMVLRMGTEHPLREGMVKVIQEAARYAVRATTGNGKVDDYDPDAMVTNFIIGMLGYYTPDGLSTL